MDYRFKDVGKTMEPLLGEATPKTEKIYPRMSLELDAVPELEGDIDDIIEFQVRAKVCGIHKSEYSNCMDLEVTEVGVPTGGNEADKVLRKLKGS